MPIDFFFLTAVNLHIWVGAGWVKTQPFAGRDHCRVKIQPTQPTESKSFPCPKKSVQNLNILTLSDKSSKTIVTRENGTASSTRVFHRNPSGYLHIGHAKSICLNFGIAQEYGGQCNLRFDDTNPEKEEVEYVESIKADIKWLGFDWEDRLFFASDYFQQLYDWAEQLITTGKAYVCSLSLEEIRTGRGTPAEAGHRQSLSKSQR